MAEGVLRSLIPEVSGGEILVSSAGTADLVGMPATENAQVVCREHGVDISGHESRALTRETLARADLVLAMTRAHEDHILSAAPGAAERTFLLSRFADGSDEDVPDPIGGPRDEYERAFDMIDSFLRSALPKILDLKGEGTR